MNEEKNFEVLSEELSEMNESLKTVENITLPESLSAENISHKLKDIPQDVNTKNTENTKKLNPSKRKNRKRLYRAVAAAAAVIIAVTSVAVVKPWQETPVEESKDEVQTEIQDYSEIEELFAEYSKNYKSYSIRNSITGFFSNSKDAAAENFAVNDSSTGTGSSVTLQSSTYYNKYNAEIGTLTEEALEGSSSDHGETNEQVQGVSEADIIKNDGKYLYIVNPNEPDWVTFYEVLDDSLDISKTTSVNTAEKTTPGYNPNDSENDEEGAAEEEKEQETAENGIPVLDYDCSVSIVEPQNDGELKTVGTVSVDPPADNGIYYMNISEIYVSGNRLLALLNGTCSDGNAEKVYYGYGDSVTIAVSFDISDIKNPKEEWRIYQQGNYVSSRLIGDELVVISDYYVDITADTDVVKANCVPEISCNDEEFSRISSSDVCVMEEVNDSSYLVASVMDTDDENTLKTKAVLGAGENVYCTTETLYATSTEYDNGDYATEIFGSSSDEKTQIYKFDIRNYEIKYLGNGCVKGHALNQFSIDEYNGNLRIATTSGNWGDSLINQLYVLGDDLKIIGSVENIAKGETIKSVRFTGDTAYVVTFEQTDPLFVIDLSDPAAPVIKGELKIPGYSAYLHPVGENLVLGVGVDGDENGANNGLKVSLFDVSDPQNPKECDKFTIASVETDNRSSFVYSDAYYDHKALCRDSENNIMYIPYSKSDYVWAYANGYSQSEKFTAGVLALRVNEAEKTLSDAGDYKVTSDNNTNIRDFSRATYINNLVFGYSANRGILCSFDKTSQDLLDTVTF